MQKVENKANVIVRQGQRVHCALYGGKDGIVVGISGHQSPESIKALGAGVVMGGNARFDVAFETYISRGVPECIVRGVQWEIFDSVADSDEILDAVQKANDAQAMAKIHEEAKAERRQAEREAYAKDSAFAHLVKVTDKPEWHRGRIAAENIRRELKRHFPGEKFSVRSDYSSVDIRWVDGPTTAEVEEFAKSHQMGNFDGMTDSYEYDNDRTFSDVFGGVRYVSCHRDDSLQGVTDAFAKRFPNGLNVGDVKVEAKDFPETWHKLPYDASGWVRRTWWGTSFRKGKIVGQKDS